MSIREKIFDQSPYEGFDETQHPGDLQGWGSDHAIFATVIEQVKPKLIIEVGSWKGRSSINMAKEVKKHNLECEILCVDTWLGSPEHWLKKSIEAYNSLKLKNGFPHLYWTFLTNVVREGCSDIITPFPSTSENAAVVLKKLGLKADLIYIDAAHEYDAVLRDLEYFWPLLSDEGVLVGDDYISWKGVTRAANEFARRQKVRLYGERGKFLLKKSDSKSYGLPLVDVAAA